MLTAGDLGDVGGPIPLRLAPLPGFDRYLQPVLARERVRYVGEPVAVVVAEDRYVAEDAAELVTMDYEPLDPVVDVHQAMTDGTVLHEATGTNVASRYLVSRGDPDAAFAAAEYTRTETFRCHRHSAMPIETRGLVAEWDAAARRMTVWGATKVTFFNRAALAGLLRLSPETIELVELDVGGSFGVRGEFYPEDFLIPFAAMRVGPAREVDRDPARALPRDESFARDGLRARDRRAARRDDPRSARAALRRHGRLCPDQWRRGPRQGRAVPAQGHTASATSPAR